MRRAIATLLFAVAFALWTLPAERSEAAPQTAKQKPRPPRKAPRKAPSPRPAESAEPSPTPNPIEREARTIESDAARLARIRARREAVEREILKLQTQTESTLRDLD